MSRKWTNEELRNLVDDYLLGMGIESLTQKYSRTIRSIEDIIRHDIPRNYRDVISRLRIDSTDSRDDIPWSYHEKNYLILLSDKLNVFDICVVLNRTLPEIQKKLGWVCRTSFDFGEPE